MPTTADAKFKPSTNDNVQLSIELDGLAREIVVTREAIEDYLRLPHTYAAAYTQAQREDFVRRNLPVISEAAERMAAMQPEAKIFIIRSGQLR